MTPFWSRNILDVGILQISFTRKIPKGTVFFCKDTDDVVSTYIICEQFISSMRINKSVLKSRLTDKHLQDSLRLASSKKIISNNDGLVDAKQCQLSDQK